jgi:hypothetical protein
MQRMLRIKEFEKGRWSAISKSDRAPVLLRAHDLIAKPPTLWRIMRQRPFLLNICRRVDAVFPENLPAAANTFPTRRS